LESQELASWKQGSFWLLHSLASTLYHLYVNGKMRPIETIPEIWGEGIKKNDGGGWIQQWYAVRTFVNVTVYPQYNNNKK
jgi:hypothetical protein